MIDIRKSNKLKHDSVFHRHFYLLLSLLLSPSFSFHLQLPQLVSFFFLPVPISFLLRFTSPPHLPAHSLSSSLPSSFLSFSSSFPPVPTLFLLSPFFIVSFYPISFILIFSFITNSVPTLCSHILSLIPAFSFH